MPSGWINENEIFSVARLPKTSLDGIKAVLEESTKIWRSRFDKVEKNFKAFWARQAVFQPRTRSQARHIKLVSAIQRGIHSFKSSGDRRNPLLHFATFNACIRRNGGPFRTSAKLRRVHHWRQKMYVSPPPRRFCVIIADMNYRYAAYWNEASEDWSKTFSDALPRYAQRTIITVTRQDVSSCEQTLSQSSDLPPEFKLAFRQSTYRIEHYNRLHRSEVQKLVKWCREKATLVREASRKKLNSSLTPFFEDVQTETGKRFSPGDSVVHPRTVIDISRAGKGKFARQREKLKVFANENSERIVTVDVGEKILEGLATIKYTAIRKYTKMNARLLTRIIDLAKSVAEQVCSAEAPAAKHDPVNDEIKNQLYGPCMEWKEYWERLQPHIRDNIYLLKDEENTDEELGAVKAETSGVSDSSVLPTDE